MPLLAQFVSGSLIVIYGTRARNNDDRKWHYWIGQVKVRNWGVPPPPQFGNCQSNAWRGISGAISWFCLACGWPELLLSLLALHNVLLLLRLKMKNPWLMYAHPHCLLPLSVSVLFLSILTQEECTVCERACGEVRMYLDSDPGPVAPTHPRQIWNETINMWLKCGVPAIRALH